MVMLFTVSNGIEIIPWNGSLRLRQKNPARIYYQSDANLPIQFLNDMLALKREHSPMPAGANLTRIRKATAADTPALHALIDASVRGLMAGSHTPEQIDGALGTLLGLDTQLIADGTYFVAESDGPAGKPFIVACGGWSKRKTLYGSDHRGDREDALLDPSRDAAKIRAFFVHPDWTRRGIGTQILESCESAARDVGFTRFELGATLTGVPLYEVRGYVAVERIEAPLRNGASLPIVRMVKRAVNPHLADSDSRR
jgi:GNAT superfamily N-acetyltransferase